MEQLSEAGARTAKERHGMHGWVAHHGTDIWINTAPKDFTGPRIWPTGGAWLLQISGSIMHSSQTLLIFGVFIHA